MLQSQDLSTFNFRQRIGRVEGIGHPQQRQYLLKVYPHDCFLCRYLNCIQAEQT